MRREAIPLLLGDDLQAVGLALAHGINVHDVDDVGEPHDLLGRVLGLVLVEDEVARAEHAPEVFPLFHAALCAEEVEPALPDYAVGVEGFVDVGGEVA